MGCLFNKASYSLKILQEPTGSLWLRLWLWRAALSRLLLPSILGPFPLPVEFSLLVLCQLD